MNLTNIGTGIKDKGTGCLEYGGVLLAILLGILIILGFIKRLIVGIKSDNY